MTPQTSTSFVVEDEAHAEQHSSHASFGDAVAELRRLAAVPWDQQPVVAPCTSWRTCGRRYEIVRYDTSTTPWIEVERVPALEISAAGARWAGEVLSGAAGEPRSPAVLCDRSDETSRGRCR